MAEPSHDSQFKFHVSINVTDLARSVEFYRVLFDLPPSKCHEDYAKFDCLDPPVVFSLVPRSPTAGGSMSHLGLHVGHLERLHDMRERLADAGYEAQIQEAGTCSVQCMTKLWTKDPDGTFWEIYVDGDSAWEAAPKTPAHHENASSRHTPAPNVWEHYLTQSWSGAIELSDDSVDEARLKGTFNAPLDDAALRKIATEAFRVLKPGGKVVTHALLADAPLPEPPPRLPGLAAMVSRVPSRESAVRVLRSVGFVGLQALKLSERVWFEHHGIGLREVRWIGWKPLPLARRASEEVAYRGPLAHAVADGGWEFPRGRRVSIPSEVANTLRLGATADQFVFYKADEPALCPSRHVRED